MSVLFLKPLQYSYFYKNIKEVGAGTSRERCMRRRQATKTLRSKSPKEKNRGSGDQAPRTQGHRPSVQGAECLLAEGEEPAGGNPVIVVPAEAQVALTAIAAEVDHTAIAVRMHPDRGEGDDRVLPLLLGVFGPEGKDLLGRARAQAALVHIAQHLVGAGRVAEVDEHGLGLGRLAGDREVFLGDVVIHPVVLPGRDQIGQRGDRALRECPDDLLHPGLKFFRAEDALSRVLAQAEGPNCVLDQLPELIGLASCDHRDHKHLHEMQFTFAKRNARLGFTACRPDC